MGRKEVLEREIKELREECHAARDHHAELSRRLREMVDELGRELCPFHAGDVVSALYGPRWRKIKKRRLWKVDSVGGTSFGNWVLHCTAVLKDGSVGRATMDIMENDDPELVKEEG